jgi:hypothetical protein
VIENDIAANAAPGEFREECLAHGFRSVAALPLRPGGKPIGARVLHATEPHFLSTEEKVQRHYYLRPYSEKVSASMLEK